MCSQLPALAQECESAEERSQQDQSPLIEGRHSGGRAGARRHDCSSGKGGAKICVSLARATKGTGG